MYNLRLSTLFRDPRQSNGWFIWIRFPINEFEKQFIRRIDKRTLGATMATAGLPARRRRGGLREPRGAVTVGLSPAVSMRPTHTAQLAEAVG